MRHQRRLKFDFYCDLSSWNSAPRVLDKGGNNSIADSKIWISRGYNWSTEELDENHALPKQRLYSFLRRVHPCPYKFVTGITVRLIDPKEPGFTVFVTVTSATSASIFSCIWSHRTPNLAVDADLRSRLDCICIPQHFHSILYLNVANLVGAKKVRDVHFLRHWNSVLHQLKSQKLPRGTLQNLIWLAAYSCKCRCWLHKSVFGSFSVKWWFRPPNLAIGDWSMLFLLSTRYW